MHLNLGVDYYPEQWGLSHLDDDLDGIAALGANIVRIGEFAWDRMEPADGAYAFSFFDEVIRRVKERGLSVMMGVPTATPPPWLYRDSPSIASVGADGRARGFGGRRGCCLNSDVYLDKAAALARALARHYRKENAIVSWQLDNELGHEGSDLCYCGDCRAAFLAFLREEYASIDALNAAWGTSFWSQTYRAFDEIPLPIPNTLTAHNPSLRFFYERFLSQTAARFIALLASEIRREIPNATILHDFSGGCLQKRMDCAAVSRALDRVACNNYPVWGGQREPLEPARIAFNLAFMRGLKDKPYIVTEQIMGAQGHDVIGYLPRPNQAKLWAMQALAHGGDGLLFFRYRGFTKGAEQLCFGILDPDNEKRRRYEEARAFFLDARRYEALLSSPVESDVCLLTDYDSLSSLRIQRHSEALDYENELYRLYKPLHRRGLNVDVLPSERDFSRYRLVVAPCMIVMRDALRTRLIDYVQGGGTLVLTFRTAWKDEENNLVFGERLPVGLTTLIGAKVEEHESLYTGQTPEVVYPDGSPAGTCAVLREYLLTTQAETLLRCDDPFFGRYAVATRNARHGGAAYYLGAAFDENLTDELMRMALCDAGFAETERHDARLEIVSRTHAGKRYSIALNHAPDPVPYAGERIEPFGYRIAEDARVK